MGTTVAADGQVLGPSDSAEMTAQHITERVAAGDTRYTGAGYSSDDIPVGRNPEHYRLEGGSLVAKSTLNTIDNLKVAAYDYINALNALSIGLEGDEARLWSSAVVRKAHDIIAQLHFGANAILTRRTTATTALTIAQRIQWCRQGLLGPRDVRSFNPLTQQAEQIHAIYQVISLDSYAVPTVPFTFVDPRNTPAAVALTEAATLGTALGLTSAITFTGDNLVDVRGSWIDKLKA